MDKKQAKELIVISSGSLKDDVIESILRWNENEFYKMRIHQMIIYCRNPKYHLACKKEYPELVYDICTSPQMLPKLLNQIMKKLIPFVKVQANVSIQEDYFGNSFTGNTNQQTASFMGPQAFYQDEDTILRKKLSNWDEDDLIDSDVMIYELCASQ